jgi:hypothetical protein
MKPIHFIQYVTRECMELKHPLEPSKSLRIDRAVERVRLIDFVLGKGAGRYEALAENFYEALAAYLNAPRHHKAQLRGAIERLAVLFEGFLRTAVLVLAPDRDVELTDSSGRSRGRLADQGYIDDILGVLCGVEVPFKSKSDSFWAGRTVEEVTYATCFRHQQRAKHESRDYSLAELEQLATQVIGSYLLFAGWALAHTNGGELIRGRILATGDEAVYYWPAILEFQLTDLRIGREDPDLQEEQDRLRGWTSELRERAAMLHHANLPMDDPEVRDFVTNIQICAEEYERLVTENTMRDWGREQQYSEYM